MQLTEFSLINPVIESMAVFKAINAVIPPEVTEQTARPTITPATPRAFLGGIRVMAVDGTVLDVPDSIANARVFGYPASGQRTRAAFPKVRMVMLIEAGTHLIVDALICPYRIGERARAKKLLRSVTRGMLLGWDRGLHSYTSVQSSIATRCDYLGRVPANVKFEVEKGYYGAARKSHSRIELKG